MFLCGVHIHSVCWTVAPHIQSLHVDCQHRRVGMAKTRKLISCGPANTFHYRNQLSFTSQPFTEQNNNWTVKPKQWAETGFIAVSKIFHLINYLFSDTAALSCKVQTNISEGETLWSLASPKNPNICHHKLWDRASSVAVGPIVTRRGGRGRQPMAATTKTAKVGRVVGHEWDRESWMTSSLDVGNLDVTGSFAFL